MKNLIFISLLSVFFLSYCATPVAPRGGERDQKPPEILGTTPTDQSTNAQPKQIVFEFDEYVNRESFRKAVSIQPAFELKVSFSFRRKKAFINLEGLLDSNTTYLITLDKSLSDMKSNKIIAPQKLAFSTGPIIDNSFAEGMIFRTDGSIPDLGSVYLVEDGARRFSYVSQPDTGGTLRFQNVRESSFRAIWSSDKNRNFRIDDGEENYVSEMFTTNIDSIVSFGTLLIPHNERFQKLESAGVLSNKRLRLRFSDSEIDVPKNISLISDIKDTLTAQLLYREPSSKEIAFYWVAGELKDSLKYSFKNDEGIDNEISIEGESVQDTTRQRLIEIENGERTVFDEPIRFVFAKPIINPAIVDSVTLISGTDSEFGEMVASVNGNVLEVKPNGDWKEAIDYEIRVWSPEDGKWAKHKPKILLEKDLSAFWVKTVERVKVQIRDEQRKILFNAVVSDSVFLDRLIPGTYSIFAFVDSDSSGQWKYPSLDDLGYETRFFDPRITLPKGFETDILIHLE